MWRLKRAELWAGAAAQGAWSGSKCRDSGHLAGGQEPLWDVTRLAATGTDVVVGRRMVGESGWEPADKPGSVVGNHPSRTRVAARL